MSDAEIRALADAAEADPELEFVRQMTEDEKHMALCFLSGYLGGRAPEGFGKMMAHIELRREREAAGA